MKTRITYLDILAAILLALFLSMLNIGCTTEPQTIIIEDWTYELPTPNSTVDKLTYIGWKGWI